MQIRHSAHSSTRKSPVNLEEKDLPLFSHELEKHIGESHVIVLDKAFILGDLIFHAGNFYSSYTHINYVRKKDRLRALSMLIRTSQKIDSATWIIDNGCAGYFHWLTDALPRLMAAELNGPVLLPQHWKKMRYMEQSLLLLGIQAIYYDPARPLKIGRLALPNHTAPSGNYNDAYIKELRAAFNRNATTSPERKIYISRKKAPKRHVLNEDEVIAVMEQAGFEIHCFEDYDFEKQVSLMQETKCLAGLHGAGLTNMLFMPEKTKVLELRNSGDSHNNCYFSMASALDIDYYYLLNKGSHADTHTSDIEVDPEALKKALSRMISS